MDENNNYILDDNGEMVKLGEEEIKYLRQTNMLDESWKNNKKLLHSPKEINLNQINQKRGFISSITYKGTTDELMEYAYLFYKERHY